MAVNKDDIKVEGMTVGKVLFTEEQIIQRAAELGKQITEDYAGKQLTDTPKYFPNHKKTVPEGTPERRKEIQLTIH